MELPFGVPKHGTHQQQSGLSFFSGWEQKKQIVSILFFGLPRHRLLILRDERLFQMLGVQQTQNQSIRCLAWEQTDPFRPDRLLDVLSAPGQSLQPISILLYIIYTHVNIHIHMYIKYIYIYNGHLLSTKLALGYRVIPSFAEHQQVSFCHRFMLRETWDPFTPSPACALQRQHCRTPG